MLRQPASSTTAHRRPGTEASSTRITGLCAPSCRPVREGITGRSIRRELPRRVRVVGGHFAHFLRGVRAKVTLIDAALLVDDEGHDARVAIGGGPGHQGEAGNHVAVDDVVVFAAGGMLALPGEDLVEVAMEGLRPR